MAKPVTIDKHIDKMLEEVANGGSLAGACRDRKYSMQAFYDQMDKDPTLKERYERAKEIRAETLIEDIMQDAKAGSDDVARDRLVVDTKKWIACKVLPKLYGDKQTINHNVKEIPTIKIEVVE